MVWHAVASLSAVAVATIGLGALGAVAISHLAPGETQAPAPPSPLLIVNAAATGPTIIPMPKAEPAPVLLEQNAGASGEAEPPGKPVVTASIERAPSPSPRRRGTDAVARLNAEPPPPKPAIERELKAQPAPRREEASLAPPPVKPAPIVQRPPPPPRQENVLTPGEINRLRRALRMTPEQEPQWPPVEALLRDIGNQQAQLIRAGRRPEEAFNGVGMRLYFTARPLLGVLREDQKSEIRRLARSMGFESAASMI